MVNILSSCGGCGRMYTGKAAHEKLCFMSVSNTSIKINEGLEMEFGGGLSMHETLGLIPSTTKNTKQKYPNELF
jgi:hypothetical protein